MFDEFFKSIKSMLYERLTSPLFGSYIASWVIINWRIFYLTLFVDQSKVYVYGEPASKLEFIEVYLINPWFVYVFPIVSAFLLIVIVPKLSYWAYIVHLKYRRNKNNKKVEIEATEIMDFKKAAKLKLEISELEQEFSKILEKKENEISTLNQRILDLDELLDRYTENSDKKVLDYDDKVKDIEFLYEKFSKHPMKNRFFTVVRKINKADSMIDSEAAEFLDYNLIEVSKRSKYKDHAFYNLTNSGNKLYERLTE